MENNDFAIKFAKLRKSSGITQQTLGNYLGVSNRAVSKWETGLAMPSTENIRKLAKIFDVPVDHFFSGLADAERSERRSDDPVDAVRAAELGYRAVEHRLEAVGVGTLFTEHPAGALGSHRVGA